MTQKLRLGEALIEAGYIDEMQLQSALGQQKQWGGRLGKALLDLGFVDEATLIKFLSERLKYPAIDLSRSKISETAFEALPKRVAEKYMAVPILIKETPGKKTLALAMADPTDLTALDEIEFVTNYKLEPYVALESSIRKVLGNYGQVEKTPQEDAAVVLDESASGPAEFVQGDMDMVDEVRKAYEASHSSAENAPEAVEIPSGSARERSSVDLGPAFTADSEPPDVNFDQPVEGDEEYISEPEEDDSPLEMISDDSVGDAEEVEEADVVEDLEPVEEPKSAQKPEAAGDPYQFDPTVEQPGEEEPEAAESVEEAEEVADEAETAEEADAVPVPDTPEAPDSEEVTEAESVEEPEPEEAEVAEDHAGQEDQAPWEVVEAQEAMVGEAEEVSEVDEIPGEAAIAPEAPPEETALTDREEEDLYRKLESCEQQLEELRGEIRRLSGKMVGLVSLFILHREGKLSKEEFLQELREL